VVGPFLDGPALSLIKRVILAYLQLGRRRYTCLFECLPSDESSEYPFLLLTVKKNVKYFEVQ
jgi:hypothetical protein